MSAVDTALVLTRVKSSARGDRPPVFNRLRRGGQSGGYNIYELLKTASK
jgi:hypothetical protein